MNQYLELREKYLKQNTDPFIVLRTTSCTYSTFIYKNLIDKGIYLMTLITIIKFRIDAEHVWLTILLLLFVTLFGITLKLWSPRTIGMRLLGLIYVSNYDFLPVTRDSSIILYTTVDKYNNAFNKSQVGNFESENTNYGVGLYITPLHTEYNQTKTMMLNGVYLVKKNVYEVFNKDYIDSGEILKHMQ